MVRSVRNAIFPVLTWLCLLLAPFLAGAAVVLLGIAGYRVANAGPRAEPPGLAAAWGIVAPAWPLLVGVAVLTLVGLYSYRRTLSTRSAEQALATSGTESLKQ